MLGFFGLSCVVRNSNIYIYMSSLFIYNQFDLLSCVVDHCVSDHAICLINIKYVAIVSLTYLLITYI